MSAYVPKYQYDIFVSYADVDNKIFPGKDDGWVTTLIKTLKIFLAQEIGSEDAFSLWSKAMLGGNIPSTYNSTQFLENSAVFLLILSPAYLKSKKCNLELNAFLAKVGENSDRIFIVEYKPAERIEALSDLLGYIFWETDSANNRRYSLNFDSKHTEKYHRETEKLANDIFKKLEELKADKISEEVCEDNYAQEEELKTDNISEEVCEDNYVEEEELNNSIETSSPKPVETSIEPKQTSIVEIDKRQWWNQLDDNWKIVFKKSIYYIKSEPSDSDLEEIFNLQELDFNGNWDKKGKIISLEPLRALTNLQKLNCQHNQISDLEPLRALTNLQDLNCSSNEISYLEPLRALTNLQDLNCSSNKISYLEPLRALTNLQYLNCSSNEISDLEPLRALTNLQILYCRWNKISDLEPLRALTNLQRLDCRWNTISNLEPICGLTNLQYLNCNSNQISDLEPLCGLSNLNYLGCRKNKISYLELDNLKKAVPYCKVNISNNELWWNQLDDNWKTIFKESSNLEIKIELEPSDSDLEKIVNLQKLYCSSKKISNLEPLRALTKLQKLYCENNQISDLEPLHALTNLQELCCYYNQISDLEPLHALTNLQSLDCRSNKLSWWNVRKFKKALPNCEVIS